MAAAQYREWAPAPALRRHVRCLWAGRLADDGTSYVDRVLPDGCVDLVWDGEGLFVAGPDTGPVPITPRPGGAFVGLRIQPGLTPAVLGLPAAALRDQRVDGREVLGGEAARLAERLHAAPALRAAAHELERAVAAHLPGKAAPDPLVERLVVLLGRSTNQPIACLADDLGVSPRQLHRRCTAGVGYGPKTLHRVLRFRRFLSRAEAGADGLARLAAEAGYVDQAHLSREVCRLAGTTPADLVASWRR